MLTETINLNAINKIKITTLLDDNSGVKPSILAQHGISILLETGEGDLRSQILFDAGQSAYPVIHNMDVLNINADDIDMIVLSHCHHDHSSGLTEMLKKINKKDIPVIGHSSIFRPIFNMKPRIKFAGVSSENSKEEIVKNGGRLVLTRKPLTLMEGVLSSGEIERVTDFESPASGNFFIIENETIYPDHALDDLSLFVHLNEKGLLIITGCSHAGIINIIRHAIKITGIQKIYGIIGGLHLMNASDVIIDKTIAELRKLDLQLIVPGHCTGIKAVAKMMDCWGDKMELLHSGKMINL